MTKDICVNTTERAAGASETAMHDHPAAFVAADLTSLLLPFVAEAVLMSAPMMPPHKSHAPAG